MSLSENLYNLGALMKTNLEEKGIDGLTGNEGLTTLANKILDVEPSVAGLELSTSIDCNVSSNDVVLGQSVVFSATLSANYDDTSIEDIDISGVLTGATVLFKKSDGTIIGSGVTDVNGVATYTHTFKAISNITVYSEFEGSTNFSSCISQNNVTVRCSYALDVTVDKEILSATNNDVATFTCRLSDEAGGVFGEPIDYQILHNDTVLSSGSKDTNGNGEITLEYAATGVGNVDVIFSYGALLQKTFVVEDCLYWNDGSSVTGLEIDSDVSCTSNNDYITITTSANSEKYVTIPTAPTGDWEFETTLAEYGDTNYMTFIMPTSSRWCQVGYDSMMTVDIGNGENRHAITLSKGAVLKVTYIDGTMSVYYNNTLIESNQVNITGKIGYYTNRGRIQHIKNIKLKALGEREPHNLVLSSTTPIIQTGDSAIVTVNLTNNDVAVSGESLSYSVKHGSTTIDTGTVTTDSNGQASITYTGTGVGDVDIVMEYGTLQETFVVEDCFKYDTTVHTRTTTSSSELLTPIYNDYSFVSDNFCAEFVWQGNGEGTGVGIAPKGRTTPYHHLLTGCGGLRLSTYIGNEISGEISERWGSFQNNVDYKFKIEYMNGTVKFYINDELRNIYFDKTYLNGETRDLYFLEWNSGNTITLKNIKLKTL